MHRVLSLGWPLRTECFRPHFFLHVHSVGCGGGVGDEGGEGWHGPSVPTFV